MIRVIVWLAAVLMATSLPLAFTGGIMLLTVIFVNYVRRIKRHLEAQNDARNELRKPSGLVGPPARLPNRTELEPAPVNRSARRTGGFKMSRPHAEPWRSQRWVDENSGRGVRALTEYLMTPDDDRTGPPVGVGKAP